MIDNQSLKYINIGNSNFFDESLINAINHNTTLETLIVYCKVNPAYLKMLNYALENNITLTKVSVIEIGTNIRESLEFLSKNKTIQGLRFSQYNSEIDEILLDIISTNKNPIREIIPNEQVSSKLQLILNENQRIFELKKAGYIQILSILARL